MKQLLDEAALTTAYGGFQWEQFRQSNNVQDYRDRYSASEDGTVYDNWSGRSQRDPTINQDPGGWRDDQTTGDRTWIGGDGESTRVEHSNGSFSPAPSVWGEPPPATNGGTPRESDFNWGQFGGGESTNGGSGTGDTMNGYGDSSGGFGGDGSSGGYGGAGFPDYGGTDQLNSMSDNYASNDYGGSDYGGGYDAA